MPTPASSEHSSLAPYAMDVAQSRGRRYSEPPHPYRNDYARDRDRVVHSRAFRRLEAKTQVFTTRYSDHFRNRLTHTLEVAQIARTVAGALNLNTDLAEALALVHDIGHPPFGHAGEHRLDALMRPYGARFDHNLHALHIVESFEQRYLAFPGLNLTFEVREGIVKHSRDYSEAEYPELAEYLLDERPPLESQLIDLVDEIAYNTADLDDGVEAGLISIEQILAGVPLVNRFYREIETRHPVARPQLLFNEALKRTLDFFATDLIETTRRNIINSGVQSVADVRAYAFTTANPGTAGVTPSGILFSTGAGVLPDAAPPEPMRLAAFSREVAQESRELKRFLKLNLYDNPAIAEDRDRGVAALDELFRHYMAHPESMPPFYTAEATAPASAGGRAAHLVVCDYVAGMTDHFLLRTHRELIGPTK
nr:dNTP triphosphohydrolase [Candidatus Acidoferrales bacterium]